MTEDLDPEAIAARFRAEREAAGLPPFIEDEGFMRLVGHVLASHRRKEHAAPDAA